MSGLFAFDAVTIERNGTRVLDDLTVTVPEHGITAIVGASGSGKSTMLRCCNLLESPDSGRITFQGEVLDRLDPRTHRRRVAMVFQQPTVFPGTAIDNLHAADPEIDARAARRLLNRVGLTELEPDRDADNLSGGEAQRLCLARALATEPQVILADEPTSALDPDSVTVLESLARTLADEGIPIVWVTHDREQVVRIADHVIEIDHGRAVSSTPVNRDTTEEQ